MVEKSKKIKILNFIKKCLGPFGNTQETFPRSRILSSASFWRGNQVDGLPRRPKSLAEERILSVSNTPSGKKRLRGGAQFRVVFEWSFGLYIKS